MRGHHKYGTRRLVTSSTNSTYSRCSSTVSTVKKVHPSTPLAWARRNCRRVSADRVGAGSTPGRWRMAQTVLAPDPALVAQPAQLTVDATVAPGRVLPGPAAPPTPEARPSQVDDHAGAGSSSGVGSALDASAVASWAGRTAVPARTRQQPGEPSQHGPVGLVHPGSGHLTPQHLDLVAQHEQLRVLVAERRASSTSHPSSW
jgi:hypothetical protein